MLHRPRARFLSVGLACLVVVISAAGCSNPDRDDGTPGSGGNPGSGAGGGNGTAGAGGDGRRGRGARG